MANGNDGGQIVAPASTVGDVAALDLALQDALSDLVAVHGIKYLDTFLERRLRRTVELMRNQPQHLPDFARAAMKREADAAEKALRDVVNAVRADPTPVT